MKKIKYSLFSILLFIIIALTSYDQNVKTIAPQQYKYTIKEYHGQVALFAYKQNTPLKIYDTFVLNLPPTDQQKLKEGIHVQQDNEMRQLIEDLTS